MNVIFLAQMIFVAAVIGIVLWLVLRKKPQARGFDVIPKSPKEREQERR